MKLLKLLGMLLAAVLLLAGGGAAYINWSGVPRYGVEKVDLKVVATPERIERGRRIVSMMCASCHRDPVTGALTGKRMPDVPLEFGTAYSKNITKHAAKGIGSWSDGEIAYLLRTGIRRDGTYTPPWMVKLPNVSDEEIASIISFLRSDDPLVRAADVDDRESEPSFLVKLLCRVAWKPLPFPRQPMPEPNTQDPVAFGKYIATAKLACFACHSADFKTNDEMHPEQSAGYMGGGNKMLDANGRVVYTANITFDKETGIGNWSEQEFVHALRDGFRPDRTPIRYPMELMAELTDAEARAIYAYLKTVPPLRNPRKPSEAYVVAATASLGQKLYYKYSCHACHGDSGTGLCDLRQALTRYPSDAELVAFIKNPASRVPGARMPAWQGVIQEDEYAPLVEFVKTLQAPATKTVQR